MECDGNAIADNGRFRLWSIFVKRCRYTSLGFKHWLTRGAVNTSYDINYLKYRQSHLESSCESRCLRG